MRDQSVRRSAPAQHNVIRSENAVPRNFIEEAADCRAQAEFFAGRPEEALLVQLAREFEKLGSAVVPTLAQRDLELCKPWA